MEENFYISKTRLLADSENFSLLREEGLKYIESLASTIWTDYNTHDPGITMMEALCYALTELGYRANFDIKDLLTNEDGTIVNSDEIKRDDTFFTAREILTNKPLTANDYRKLLIDIEGVHNAWVFPEKSVTVDAGEVSPKIPKTEVDFYPCCKEDRLVYKNTEHEAIEIKGLYNVLLDLDNTSEYGDLNTGNILYNFTESNLIGVVIEAYLNNWETNSIEIAKIIKQGNFKVSDVVLDPKSNEFSVTINYGAGYLKGFHYTIGYTLKPDIENVNALILVELKQKTHHVKIASSYIDKIERTLKILKEAHKILNANRNLCEDFRCIDTVKDTEIGFCADIEVKSDVDIEQVLAEVYYAINNYFNPTVTFYLLSELVAKGITTDVIFEGTKLQHGFIDNEELDAAMLRSDIRVSDIINLVMDIDGVVAIKNVLLTAYNDDGTPIKPSQRWCVHLSDNHKPVLNINKSKILFFKDRLPFKAKTYEALDILNYLIGMKDRPKLKGHQNDLPIPVGTYYNFSDYYTVQYELPQTYGISIYGLPDSVSDERKAQALQLRAYLLFFDQILADFFSQLANSKKLFSLSDEITQTYFSNYIDEVKDIDKVYSSSYDLKLIQEAAAIGNAPNELLHQNLIESSETFNVRRNLFLDHLLARFSETFNDYVLMMFSLDGTKTNPTELIHDKIKFLKDYPIISSERGSAFNYIKPIWVDQTLSLPECLRRTQNVSGLEKRVARFAGIEDYSQRDLFCLPDISIVESGGNYSFMLKDGATIYLTNYELKEYKTVVAIEALVNQVYENFLTKGNYIIEQEAANQYYVRLRDESKCIIASSPTYFKSEEKAKEHIATILVKFAAKCDSEGMHLIEHILLRPLFNAPKISGLSAEEIYKLMQVCLSKDCEFCGEQDPYSFRATVLLPYWNRRFKNMNFRKYFEKIMRTEAPAHISLKICWINFTSMKKFEKIFKNWLEAMQELRRDFIVDDESKMDDFREANNAMIDFLANVHSEYPEAHLHDCEEGESNPVLLGSTVLGG